MTRPRLYLNFVTELEWLIALEFGRVDDAQPPENWRGVSDSFGFLCEGPGGRAYRHLRHYTEIAPSGSWNWCWYGKAARDVGETTEAMRAFATAIELEQEGDQETDAHELLDELIGRND